MMSLPTKLDCSLIVLLVLSVSSCADSLEPMPEPIAGEPLQFLRLVDYRLSCIAQPSAQHFRFDDQKTLDRLWQTTGTCLSAEAPTVNFDDYFILGTILEGECAYSGCGNNLALFSNLTFDGDQLSIRDRNPTQAELGNCLACVQPRDFILVSNRFSEFDVDVKSTRAVGQTSSLPTRN